MSVRVKEESVPTASLEDHGGRPVQSAVASLLNDARLLLIAVWLGAAVFFSFAVAPSAFAVLPARDLAAAVVGRTLAIVNVSGFIVSLLLLASVAVGRAMATRRWALFAEALSLAVLTVVTAVGHWIIAARIEMVRRMMNRSIDDVAAEDPLRIAFSNLHLFSVVLLVIGMIAATIALLLVARRVRPRIS